MPSKTTNRGGLIRTVLIIVAVLIVLGYFGYNLRDIINSPNVHDNLSYAWEVCLRIWEQIKRPVTIVWNLILMILGRVLPH